MHPRALATVAVDDRQLESPVVRAATSIPDVNRPHAAVVEGPIGLFAAALDPPAPRPNQLSAPR